MFLRITGIDKNKLAPDHESLENFLDDEVYHEEASSHFLSDLYDQSET
jgi:hypothetical protein